MSDDKTIITDAVGLTIFNQPKRKRACLVQYSGANLGKRYILDLPEVVIGRAPNAPIVINDTSVSRQHAKCIQGVEKVELEDMGSSNGTFINDQKLTARTTLHDGDIIRLGTILLKFFAHDNVENIFHDKIYRMATIDAGTQIFNKKYLMESMDTEFKFSRTYDRALSIIIFDLDFFKKMNDQNGHNAGDFILRECAALAKSAVRKDDILGRFGGEEFCVILPNTDARTAFELAERIRAKIEGYVFNFEGKPLRQTISAGVSQLVSSIPTPQALIEDADRKLYKSKHDGRNRVTI